MLETEAGTKWGLHSLQAALLAVIYFSTAKLSLALAIPPGYATPVWPPSGIALAALLLLGLRAWPGVWLGAAALNIVVHQQWLGMLIFSTGNTLEAVLGAMLIRRYIGVPRQFGSGEDVLKFVVLSALCATVAASVAMVPLYPSLTWTDMGRNWLTWWQGDTTGMIIVAPLIMSWTARDATRWPARRRLEAACFALLLIAASELVFSRGDAAASSLNLTFLILLFIVWAAFRFGQREVTAAIAAVSVVAVWHTAQGRGPFALGSQNESLMLILAFISTLVALGLVLCAVLDQRRRITDALRQAVSDLREQSITDPLTNLSNRRCLWEYLPRELIRATRNGSSVAVIMFDIDYFKKINDTYGHTAGDMVLSTVGKALQSQIRGSDLACRYGGEEFAVVLPDATPEGAHSKAEDMRAALKQLRLHYDDRSFGITASFGVALFPENASGMNSLIRAADEAVYAAKGGGRDCVMVSTTKPRVPRSPKDMVLQYK